MDTLSRDELERLAAAFGVGLPDAQAETVHELVNGFLEPLDDVEGMPVGLHLQSEAFTERRLVGVAARAEAVLD